MTVQWKDIGGHERAIIGGGLIRITVAYNATRQKGELAGYTVTINRMKLKGLFPTIQTAKERGIAAAKHFTRKAMQELELLR